MTGEPLARFDPLTGKPLDLGAAGEPLDAQPGTTDRP